LQCELDAVQLYPKQQVIEMKFKNYWYSAGFILILFSLLLVACGGHSTNNVTPTTAIRPDWFAIKLTDARTGATFTMNDFAGKVVLIEIMAMWCPNCLFQANEVRKLHKLLDNPEDLVSVSLDVDLNEDKASLSQYVQEYNFEWRFAIAPLEMQRAHANLYSPEYHNPPLSPMLLIDRAGNVHQLEYELKDAETLKKYVQPYLTP
jgi:thiol-disulfide isomerase/thioredoxin